jgi:hypothetical protein
VTTGILLAPDLFLSPKLLTVRSVSFLDLVNGVSEILPLKLRGLNNTNVRPATPQQSPIKQLD